MKNTNLYETLSTRTKNKLVRIQQNIFQLYPEISELGIQVHHHQGFRGGKAGFELCFQLRSDNQQLDGVSISCKFTKDISQTEPSSILRQFRQRYSQFVINNKISQ